MFATQKVFGIEAGSRLNKTFDIGDATICGEVNWMTAHAVANGDFLAQFDQLLDNIQLCTSQDCRAQGAADPDGSAL